MDSNKSHLIKTHLNIIPPHLHLYLLSGLFCLGVYDKMLYIFIIFHLLLICVTNLIFHGYLNCTSSTSFNMTATAENMTSNDRVDNWLRFGKYLAGSSSFFWDVTQRRMLVFNQPTLHNTPERRLPWFHHGGILKSHILKKAATAWATLHIVTGLECLRYNKDKTSQTTGCAGKNLKQIPSEICLVYDRYQKKKKLFPQLLYQFLIFVVPCIMLNSEINPTRCNNCVYSSQSLYSTCFGWHCEE